LLQNQLKKFNSFDGVKDETDLLDCFMIGSGGQGTCYQKFQISKQRFVAFKV
jgi:hypothetical protein